MRLLLAARSGDPLAALRRRWSMDVFLGAGRCAFSPWIRRRRPPRPARSSEPASGFRIGTTKDGAAPRGISRTMVNDADAPPLWARFYEIGTNEPLLLDRDGKRRASFADLSAERRSGYVWFSDWPRQLLEKDYPRWQARQAPRRPSEPMRSGR